MTFLRKTIIVLFRVQSLNDDENTLVPALSCVKERLALPADDRRPCSTSHVKAAEQIDMLDGAAPLGFHKAHFYLKT